MVPTVRRHAAPLPDGVRRLARAGWVLMGLALVGPGRPLVTPWLVAGVAAACVAACLDVCPPEAVEEAAGSVEEAGS